MHFRHINNKPGNYIQGLRKFKNVFPKNIKNILNKKNFIIYEILDKWKIIVGDKIANISVPRKLKYLNNQNCCILFISVNRGDELEVEYNKNRLINNINSYFGYQLIAEIKLESFSQTMHKIFKVKKPVSKKKSKMFVEKLNNVSNLKVRGALTKLIDIIKK